MSTSAPEITSAGRLLFIVMFLALFTNSAWAQTAGSSKQLKEDGLTQRQVKLLVGLFFRDAKSGAALTKGSVRISLITNSKDQYVNGKAVQFFTPNLAEIGTLDISTGQPQKGSSSLPIPSGSVFFYLFYNKEYLVEIMAPGYVPQKFTMKTTLPQPVYDSLIKHSGEFNSILRNYRRYVDMIPCTGNCQDTTTAKSTVSYSGDSSRFNMIINRPVVVENSTEPNSHSYESQHTVSTETRAQAIGYSENTLQLSLLSPSPGASAYLFNRDTINLIDIYNMKEGPWIHFGSESGNSVYPVEAKYFKGNYRHDRREGPWVKFYPNGDTAAVLHFNKSSLSGEFSFFYSNGTIEQSGFWNSTQKSLNGIYREYYEDGVIHKQSQYDNSGSRTGTQSVYYPNGNTAVTATMQRDTLQGYVSYYLDNGVIFLQQLYEKGKLVGEQFLGGNAVLPQILNQAFIYLLIGNNSPVYVRIQNSLAELSRIDENYAQLLRERDDQLIAANLKLSEKDKVLWETRSELSRSELERELQSSEVLRQKIANWSMVTILILMLVLAFVLLRNNNRRKRAYRLLQIQKDEIHLQKKHIEEKSKDVADSIESAGRIQKALLTSRQFLEKNLRSHFIFFQPRDIVSGDFYWAQNKNGKFYLAICDSTGHGVPGAFMSLLNMTFLSQAVLQEGIQSPERILEYVRTRVVDALNPEGAMENSKEGMDAVLMTFDFETNELQIAGANNSVWIVRPDIDKNDVIEIKGDKQPIGYTENPKAFNLQKTIIKKGDMIYAFSDGYADQFGGEKGKKFKTVALKKLLSEISADSTSAQLDIIRSTHLNWKGNLEQVDDICVVGIRV